MFVMKKFGSWIFRRHANRQIVQGPTHAQNIQDLYQIIHDVAREEFNEDNDATLDDFLREQFEKTQITPPITPEPRVIIKEIPKKLYQTSSRSRRTRRERKHYRRGHH